ncbi:hypothetical protein GOODEAATRI_008618 [Goodea atripinnis]|uniref:Uncharacterized protein n=1 Tax=Goodea atripinnis TaxID=208336 RepID=A0ABV0NSX3_9TELE
MKTDAGRDECQENPAGKQIRTYMVWFLFPLQIKCSSHKALDLLLQLRSITCGQEIPCMSYWAPMSAGIIGLLQLHSSHLDPVSATSEFSTKRMTSCHPTVGDTAAYCPPGDVGNKQRLPEATNQCFMEEIQKVTATTQPLSYRLTKLTSKSRITSSLTTDGSLRPDFVLVLQLLEPPCWFWEGLTSSSVCFCFGPAL